MTTKARRQGVSLDQMMDRLPPARRAAVEERAAALIAQHNALRDIRKATGKTQVSVAKELGVGQDSVARMEQRGDMLLSTFNNYVRAIGGKMRLVVEVEGHAPFELAGLEDLAPWETCEVAASRKAACTSKRGSLPVPTKRIARAARLPSARDA